MTRVITIASLIACTATAAAAQTPIATAPAAGAPAAAATASAATPAAAAPAAEAPATQGFTYDAEGRRDPFVSLAKRGTDTSGAPARIAGLAGLGAGEVTLRGTVQSPGGYVGIVQGADNRTYIVRAGARLADGTVRAITPDAMVILQQVTDPLSLQKQREVRKTLRQTEEAK